MGCMSRGSGSGALLRMYAELFAFVIIGAAPWILVNAVWIELPLFVIRLPEGYGIAPRLALAVQCSNVVPFLYGIAPRRFRPRVEVVIFVLLFALACACTASSIAWDATVEINGADASFALIAITFLAGACGTLSNVTLWPFVSRYPAPVMLATSIGMGLSSLVPSVLGIAQSPGSRCRFSATAFFAAVAGTSGASLLTFACVVWVARRRTVHAPTAGTKDASDGADASSPIDVVEIQQNVRGDATPQETAAHPLANDKTDEGEQTPLLAATTSDVPARTVFTPRELFALAIMFFASLLNFFVPSVVSYLPSRLPHTANVMLALTVAGMTAGTLGRMACLFAFTVRGRSRHSGEEKGRAEGDSNPRHHDEEKRRVEGDSNPPPASVVGVGSGMRLVLVLPRACLCVQAVAFAMLFVGGYPVNASSSLLVVAYGVASACFGCTSTLLYRSAVMTHRVGREAEAACTRLAFVEQAGATLGTLVAFLLVHYDVFN